MSNIGHVIRSLRDENLVSLLVKTKGHIDRRFRIKLLNRRHNVSIHPTARIEDNTKFGLNGTIEIGSECRIRNSAMVLPYGGRVSVGDGTGVNPFTILYGHGGLEIGENCLIAAHSVIIPANHNINDTSVTIREQGATKEGITISDDVWIGTNCSILDGVTIGEGSVIAAGSVVTEDVPSYSVAAGVPAAQIDSR